MKTVTTAGLRIRVRVHCEGCDKRFSFRRRLTDQASGRMANVGPALQAGLLKSAMKLDFAPKRCPHCGFLQSWMQPTWRTTYKCGLVGVGGGVVFMLLYIMLQNLASFELRPIANLVILVTTLVCGIVIMVMLLRPLWRYACKVDLNKRWHRVNGPIDPPPRRPDVAAIPWMPWAAVFSFFVAGLLLVGIGHATLTGWWKWGWMSLGTVFLLGVARVVIKDVLEKDKWVNEPI